MVNFWMVRAGEGAYLVDEFISLNFVAIGWNDIGDLSKLKKLDSIKNKLKITYPEAKSSQINNYAGQIFRFLVDFKVNDSVVTYNPSTRKYHIGKIKSEYKYSTELEFHNKREVKWEFDINRDSLSTRTKNSLGSVMTIFKLPEHVVNEIIDINKLSPRIKKGIIEDGDDLESIKEDTEAKAFEFIKDKVLSLDWAEMEIFIGGILRGMGYKTMMSPKGPDRGKDIIASPDGLGLEDPKIKVEVKHRKGAMGAPEIRNFIGGLRPTDKGLYVSTGGFTKEANYEAERSNIPITLVDSDMIVKLIIQYYDNFDIDTRSMIPLRKIYWPI